MPIGVVWLERTFIQWELALIARRLSSQTSTVDFCAAITRAASLHERLLTAPRCYWPTAFDVACWVAAR